MTDTKPVLTPRVGDVVDVVGWGVNTILSKYWFIRRKALVKNVWSDSCDVEVEGCLYNIGLRSVVEILPAQEEKPKAEPATDEEIRNYQLLSSPLSPRQTVALFDRIEADRETSKDNHRRMEKLSDEASRWENECEQLRSDLKEADEERVTLRAQNAEQAQEIARLKDEIAIGDKLLADRDRILDAEPCKAHGRCIPHVLEILERRKCEQRIGAKGVNLGRRGSKPRRTDRRKAK